MCDGSNWTYRIISIAKRYIENTCLLFETMSAEGNNIQIQLTQNGIREMQRERSEYRPVYFNPSYSNYYLLDGQPIPTYFHRHFVASIFNVIFLLLTSTRLLFHLMYRINQIPFPTINLTFNDYNPPL